MPIETVNIAITGANPTTQSVQMDIDLASGNGTTTFQYTGANFGLDTVVAAIPTLSLTSNIANVLYQLQAPPYFVVNDFGTYAGIGQSAGIGSAAAGNVGVVYYN